MPEELTAANILEDYLAVRDAGSEADPADVIRANPMHRQQLIRCFAAQARLQAIRPHPVVADPDVPLRTARGERFEDFRLLGVGGMGVVYRATDLRLNAHVALKVLRTDGLDTTQDSAPASPFDLAPPPPGTPGAQRFEAWKARFLHEVSITGSLDHPNIVPIYDVAQTAAGVPFYTMRYYGGLRTLATAIEGLEGRTPVECLVLLDPYLKLCDTIHYAHTRGVVHRDLKPENVLLGEFGEVIVADWGLATLEGTPDRFGPARRRRVWERRRARSDITQPGALGTVGYMAPEAVRGDPAETTARMDVFSLGAVLFEILNGWTPHESGGASSTTETDAGSPVRQPPGFHPAVPRGLRGICNQAMARAKEDRYANAGELADAIRAWRTQAEARTLREDSLAATEDALRKAADLRGEDRLVAIGYARELLAPAAGLEPPDPRAQAQALEAVRLWKQGMNEHGRRRRRRDLVVIAILALAAVAALGAAMCYVFRLGTVAPVAAGPPLAALRAPAQVSCVTGVRSSAIVVSDCGSIRH